jgi:hypothetical protein
LQGWIDGWHGAIIEMQLRIYRHLNTRSEQYRAQKVLETVFKIIGELDEQGRNFVDTAKVQAIAKKGTKA